MIKKYIKNNIDQSVNVEPNFDKIDNLINYEQFNNKRNNKINIVKCLSVLCTACAMIIISFLLIPNLQTPPPGPTAELPAEPEETPELPAEPEETPELPIEPAGIVNEYDSSNEPTMASPFFYKITTDKSEYLIDEEVKITLELGLAWFQRYAFEEGDLNIKISNSNSYEVIDQSEYVIENFIAMNEGNKESEYFSTNDNNYPIKLTFTIKSIKENSNLSMICFLFKFNYTDKETWLSERGNILGDWWFDFDEEYIFNIKGMYFVNVDGNMKLSLSQVELINESVNKEYENGKIGKSDYVDELFSSLLMGNIFIDYSWNASQGLYDIRYYSNSIRLNITIDKQDNEFVKNVLPLLENEDNKEAAKLILNYVNTQKILSADLYEVELHNIKKTKVISLTSFYVLNYVSKDFSDFEDYWFNYKYILD